jgi:hypothetical protein
MSKICLVFFGILLAVNSFGQVKQSYHDLVNDAHRLYENKEYLKSARQYSRAFDIEGGGSLTLDRISAASAWCLADLYDSAFVQLFRMVEDSTFTNYVWMIVHQPELNPLHSDNRWSKVIETIKSNFTKKERNLDMNLVAVLDSVYIEDQVCQQQYVETAAKYGRQSEELKSFATLMKDKYSVNQIIVEKILDERGWLGEEIIGHYGNMALFLVIQHSNIETQEKYLSMMREAVKKGNANPANLALLEDRVALRQGKKQIYGTQLAYDETTGESYVQPLEDPDNVDDRRAAIGLGKLQAYLSGVGMKWDPEEYKKKLPGLEAKQKNKK